MRTTFTFGALAALLATLWACEQLTDPEDPEALAGGAALARTLDWGEVESVDPGGVIGINTADLDGCPIESPDGRALFFATNRNPPAGSTTPIDIWVSRRAGKNAEWGEPEKLPEPINSAQNDFCPTPLPGGRLMFVSTRPGTDVCGGADMYQARLHPTKGWIDLEHLGCVVNSDGNEFAPSYVNAGGGMLFFSSSQGDPTGMLHNIYVSHRQGGGGWSTPVAVAELNLAGFSTARPNVSQDGRMIVFDSNRPHDIPDSGNNIWISTRANVNTPWSDPVPAGSNVNTTDSETRASLSRDGKRLYFGSNHSGEGSSDIFVVTLK